MKYPAVCMMDWVRWTTLGLVVFTWVTLIVMWALLIKLRRRP